MRHCLDRTVMTVAIAASLLGTGCETMRKFHGRPAVQRSTAPAASSTTGAPKLEETNLVIAPGIVEPWGGEVALSPQESGWIAQVLVAEGQHVDAGELLAVLDDETQRAAVEIAKADVAEAETGVAKSAHGSTTEELQQARADADASQARADLARRDAERAARLGAGSAISPAEVDRAKAEAEAQEAAARKAAAHLAELERGPRAEDRTAVRDRSSAARARLALAEANLRRRHVVAPVAGMVLRSRSHPGEFFNVGAAALFVLGDLSRVQVRLEVDEVDAFRMRGGARCGVYGDDDAAIAQGTVVRLAPSMGRRALAVETPTARADVRVREVFVEVPEESALVPGRRVWGHIEVGDRTADLTKAVSR